MTEGQVYKLVKMYLSLIRGEVSNVHMGMPSNKPKHIASRMHHLSEHWYEMLDDQNALMTHNISYASYPAVNRLHGL